MCTGWADAAVRTVATFEGLVISMNRAIQQADMTFVNMYELNTGALHIKLTLTNLKGEIESYTITIGDCNTPLLSIHRSPRQKDQ